MLYEFFLWGSCPARSLVTVDRPLHCSGIRSERRLCEEIHLNLPYRWFCRLDLNDHIPDHSTFSKKRRGRFRKSDLLRHVFEATVERCMQEGLVGGQGFAIDTSLISADVQKQNSSNPVDWQPVWPTLMMPPAQCKRISTHWTTKPSVRRLHTSPRLLLISTRLANGRLRVKFLHSLRIPPIV